MDYYEKQRFKQVLAEDRKHQVAVATAVLNGTPVEMQREQSWEWEAYTDFGCGALDFQHNQYRIVRPAPHLPDKPSELIQLGLSCLNDCEKDAGLKPLFWNTMLSERCCFLSYAVICQYFGAEIDGDTQGDCFGASNEHKLDVLDCMSAGDFSGGADIWGISFLDDVYKEIEKLPRLASYKEDPDEYKAGLQALIKVLEKARI